MTYIRTKKNKKGSSFFFTVTGNEFHSRFFPQVDGMFIAFQLESMWIPLHEWRMQEDFPREPLKTQT